MDISGEVVETWLRSVDEEFKVSLTSSASNHQAVMSLAKISIVLSNLWQTCPVELKEATVERIWSLLEDNTLDTRLEVLCLHALLSVEWKEPDCPAVVQKLLTRFTADVMNPFDPHDEQELSLRRVSCQYQLNMVSKMFAAQVSQSMTTNLFPTLKTILHQARLCLDKSILGVLLPTHLQQLTSLLTSNVPRTVQYSVIPDAFAILATMATLKCDKAATFNQELFCQYWHFVVVQLSCLADVSGDQERSVTLTTSFGGASKVVLNGTRTSQEQNKHLLMSMIAPVDGVGILVSPLKSLLNVSRVHASMCYYNLTLLLTTFRSWHTPSATFKLLLRCMHHFAVIPFPSAQLSETTKCLSNLSNHAITIRTMGCALTALLGSVAHDHVAVMRAVAVPVPNQAVLLSSSASMNTSRGTSRATSPTAIINSGSANASRTPTATSTSTTPAKSSSSDRSVGTPGSSMTSSTLKITVFDLLDMIKVLVDKASASNTDDVSMERRHILIHTAFVHAVHKAEASGLLPPLTSDAAQATECYSAVNIPWLNDIKDADSLCYFASLPAAHNQHWAHLLRHRHSLRAGLFSFRDIFQRSDYLTSNRGTNAPATEITALQSFDLVEELDQVLHLMQDYICSLEELVLSDEPSEKRAATSGDTENVSSSHNLCISEDILQEVMESLGQLWQMQVYLIAYRLFQQIRGIGRTRDAIVDPLHRQQQQQGSHNKPTADEERSEFRVHLHYHGHDDEYQQSTAAAVHYSQTVFSQQWYQSTQLESLSCNSNPNAASQQQLWLHQHHNSQPTTTAAAAESVLSYPYHNAPPAGSGSNSTTYHQNQQSHVNGAAPKSAVPQEQVVLCSSYPPAMSMTVYLLHRVYQVFKVVFDRRESLGPLILHSLMTSMLEPLLESLWWWLHRTTAFARDFDEEIQGFHDNSTAAEGSGSSHSSSLDSIAATAKEEREIVRGFRAAFQSLGQRMAPALQLECLPNLAIGHAIGLTVLYFNALEQVQCDLHQRTTNGVPFRSFSETTRPSRSVSSHIPATLNRSSMLIAQAVQKSMNSLTESGLLPTVFAMLPQLLMQTRFVLEPQPQTPQASTGVHKHIQHCRVLNLALTEDSKGNQEKIAEPREPQTTSTSNGPMMSKALSSTSPSTASFLAAIVQHAVLKLSSMVAPSLSEQQSPEIMYGMTSGLRDIFTALFLLLQHEPSVASTSNASVEWNHPMQDLWGSHINNISSNHKSQRFIMALDGLFRLWLVLEDILFHHFRRGWESATHIGSDVDSMGMDYDRDYLLPALNSWIDQHSLLVPIISNELSVQQQAINIFATKQMVDTYWQFRWCFLRRMYGLALHHHLTNAASRTTPYLMRYFLGEMVTFLCALAKLHLQERQRYHNTRNSGEELSVEETQIAAVLNSSRELFREILDTLLSPHEVCVDESTTRVEVSTTQEERYKTAKRNDPAQQTMQVFLLDGSLFGDELSAGESMALQMNLEPGNLSTQPTSSSVFTSLKTPSMIERAVDESLALDLVCLYLVLREPFLKGSSEYDIDHDIAATDTASDPILMQLPRILSLETILRSAASTTEISEVEPVDSCYGFSITEQIITSTKKITGSDARAYIRKLIRATWPESLDKESVAAVETETAVNKVSKTAENVVPVPLPLANTSIAQSNTSTEPSASMVLSPNAAVMVDIDVKTRPFLTLHHQSHPPIDDDFYLTADHQVAGVQVQQDDVANATSTVAGSAIPSVASTTIVSTSTEVTTVLTRKKSPPPRHGNRYDNDDETAMEVCPDASDDHPPPREHGHVVDMVVVIDSSASIHPSHHADISPVPPARKSAEGFDIMLSHKRSLDGSSTADRLWADDDHRPTTAAFAPSKVDARKGGPQAQDDGDDTNDESEGVESKEAALQNKRRRLVENGAEDVVFVESLVALSTAEDGNRAPQQIAVPSLAVPVGSELIVHPEQSENGRSIEGHHASSRQSAEMIQQTGNLLQRLQQQWQQWQEDEAQMLIPSAPSIALGSTSADHQRNQQWLQTHYTQQRCTQHVHLLLRDTHILAQQLHDVLIQSTAPPIIGMTQSNNSALVSSSNAPTIANNAEKEPPSADS